MRTCTRTGSLSNCSREREPNGETAARGAVLFYTNLSEHRPRACKTVSRFKHPMVRIALHGTVDANLGPGPMSRSRRYGLTLGVQQLVVTCCQSNVLAGRVSFQSGAALVRPSDCKCLRREDVWFMERTQVSVDSFRCLSVRMCTRQLTRIVPCQWARVPLNQRRMETDKTVFRSRFLCGFSRARHRERGSTHGSRTRFAV